MPRFGMAGSSSRTGARVARRSLGSVASRRRGGAVYRGALGSLGDDTLGVLSPPIAEPGGATTSPPAELAISQAVQSEAEWRAEMLKEQRLTREWQERWVKRDELQRWLQIGATLAIPLSAAVWRAIFRAGRKRKG